MLKCKEVTHLLSEAQDHRLPLKERLPLQLHLVICQGCRNYGKQLDLLRAATRGYRDAARDEDTK